MLSRGDLWKRYKQTVPKQERNLKWHNSSCKAMELEMASLDREARLRPKLSSRSYVGPRWGAAARRDAADQLKRPEVKKELDQTWLAKLPEDVLREIWLWKRDGERECRNCWGRYTKRCRTRGMVPEAECEWDMAKATLRAVVPTREYILVTPGRTIRFNSAGTLWYIRRRIEALPRPCHRGRMLAARYRNDWDRMGPCQANSDVVARFLIARCDDTITMDAPLPKNENVRRLKLEVLRRIHWQKHNVAFVDAEGWQMMNEWRAVI